MAFIHKSLCLSLLVCCYFVASGNRQVATDFVASLKTISIQLHLWQSTGTWCRSMGLPFAANRRRSTLPFGVRQMAKTTTSCFNLFSRSVVVFYSQGCPCGLNDPSIMPSDGCTKSFLIPFEKLPQVWSTFSPPNPHLNHNRTDSSSQKKKR